MWLWIWQSNSGLCRHLCLSPPYSLRLTIYNKVLCNCTGLCPPKIPFDHMLSSIVLEMGVANLTTPKPLAVLEFISFYPRYGTSPWILDQCNLSTSNTNILYLSTFEESTVIPSSYLVDSPQHSPWPLQWWICIILSKRISFQDCLDNEDLMPKYWDPHLWYHMYQCRHYSSWCKF